MTRVIDSSAWIEWLADSPIGHDLATAIPSPEECIIPTIVQYEVIKWLRREADEDRADAFLAFTSQCIVMDFDTPLALLAADLSRDHKLAMADAIVLATARRLGVELVTCDVHFAALEGVHCFSKT